MYPKEGDPVLIHSGTPSPYAGRTGTFKRMESDNVTAVVYIPRLKQEAEVGIWNLKVLNQPSLAGLVWACLKGVFGK